MGQFWLEFHREAVVDHQPKLEDPLSGWPPLISSEVGSLSLSPQGFLIVFKAEACFCQ